MNGEERPPSMDTTPLAGKKSDEVHQERIGPYRILDILGEGGMGTVYLAEQEEPVRRKVALKLIKIGLDTKEVIGRFESERQALAMMDHPNIAHVLDAGSTERGRPYFVMEHVHGIAINKYCDKHGLSTRERLELFIPVCQAIHHAHQKGVIHRDLKPSNILVSVLDGKPVPKVIDFGVAKATNQRLTEKTVYTELGQLIGTPEYMSPEQAEMTELGVDTTTDVYSLGVVLYELLAGALPFDSATLRKAGLAGIQRIIRNEEPPNPSTKLSSLGEEGNGIADRRGTALAQLARQIRGELDWITMRAMDKDPTRRYPAASELAADIERYLQGDPVLARPPSTTYRLSKMVQRHRTLVFSVMAVFLALAIGLALSTTMFFRAEQAKRKAEYEARKAEQVSDFLQKMMSSVDPAQKGHEVMVREVLDEMAGSIEHELADQPEIQAAVRSTIGNMYLSLGLYDEAEPQLRSAMRMRRELLGEEHRDHARSMDELALLLVERGEYEEAEPLSREALRILEALQEGDHPDIALSLNTHARLLLGLKRYEEAEAYCRRALDMRKRLFGGEHAEVATSLNDLALLLKVQGKVEKAEPLYREALAMNRKLHGEEHFHVATGLHNLAGVLRTQGRLEQAGPLYEKALAMKQRLLGEKHPSVANSLNNLASLYRDQGRYAEAEPLSREAVELYREHYGEAHPYFAISLRGLGALLLESGQPEEAEPILRRSLAIQRIGTPDGDWRTALTENLIGACLQARGDYDEAERVMLRGFDDILAAKNCPAGSKARAAGRIAELYGSLGDAQKSLDYKALSDSLLP